LQPQVSGNYLHAAERGYDNHAGSYKPTKKKLRCLIADKNNERRA
jgi:hypothetical protein